MRPLRVLTDQGLEDINTFLESLKDGPEYQARLAALEDQKKEINGLIAVYGKASEIDRIVSDSLNDREQARKTFAKALEDRTLASEEIKAAKLAAQVFIDERKANSLAQIAARERALVDGEAALEAGEQKLGKDLDDLMARELASAKEMSDAKEMRAKYTEAVASLEAAIDQTRKAL